MTDSGGLDPRLHHFHKPGHVDVDDGAPLHTDDGPAPSRTPTTEETDPVAPQVEEGPLAAPGVPTTIVRPVGDQVVAAAFAVLT